LVFRKGSVTRHIISLVIRNFRVGVNLEKSNILEAYMANIDEKAGISEIGTSMEQPLPCTDFFLSFFGGSSSSYGGTVLREK